MELCARKISCGRSYSCRCVSLSFFDTGQMVEGPGDCATGTRYLLARVSFMQVSAPTPHMLTLTSRYPHLTTIQQDIRIDLFWHRSLQSRHSTSRQNGAGVYCYRYRRCALGNVEGRGIRAASPRRPGPNRCHNSHSAASPTTSIDRRG